MAGAENAHRPGTTIQPSGGPERDELTTVDRYAEVDVELSAVGARVGAGSGPLVVVNGEMREKERRPTIPDDAATCDVPCSGGISLVAACTSAPGPGAWRILYFTYFVLMIAFSGFVARRDHPSTRAVADVT